MKPRNIQETIEKNKLKMKYLSGLITENEFNQLSEIEIEEPVATAPTDTFRPSNYFSEKKKKFSPESENDSNRLLHALLKSGVADIKKYPEWVFKALIEDGYVEQEGDGSWFLNKEGKGIFRTPIKFQQYLITADEDDVAVSDTEGTELDEDMSHNPKEYNDQFKNLAQQIEDFEVKFGVNFSTTTIKQFIEKAHTL